MELPGLSASSPGGANALDPKSLDTLKQAARSANSAQGQRMAIRQAAKQVESLFLEQLIKSMRAALPQSDALDGPGQDTMRAMLDSKLAGKLADRGVGLGEAIARQLERASGLSPGSGALTDAPSSAAEAAKRPGQPDAGVGPSTLGRFGQTVRQGPTMATDAPGSMSKGTAPDGTTGAWADQDWWQNGSDSQEDQVAGNVTNRLAADPGYRSTLEQLRQGGGRQGLKLPEGPSASQANAARPLDDVAVAKGGTGDPVKSFVRRLWSEAKGAEQSTGIPAHFILGQAALETGWGRYEIRGSDGARSFNMFGIKAGGSWKGATVDSVTTEYVNGKARKVVERFRAYGSYEEAFKDYAGLLAKNPRFQATLAAGGSAERFAQSLQRAGYATDPAYAEKLTRVIEKTLKASA